jgi:capsular polysaccharide transport system permease protein
MALAEEFSTVWRGARMQQRVIGALVIRELGGRFGRYYFGYIWLFIEPLLLGAAIGLVHYWRDRPTAFGAFEFFAIGYILFFVFRGILNRAPIAIPGNQALLYHRHVTLPDIFFARHLIEAISCFGVLIILLLGLFAVDGSVPESPIKVVGAMLLMALLSQGLAFLAASFSHEIEIAGRFLQALTFIIMPVGGLFFLVEWLPDWAQEIVLWIPTVHLFELLRDGQFGSRFRAVYDLSYVAAWIFMTHLLGLSALRITRQRIGLE